MRPEQGLLKLRKEMGTFGNLRPCFFASDSLLGLHTFYPGFSLWQIDAIIMTGYLAGQALMVLGVLHHLAAVGGTTTRTTTARAEGTSR